jgi:hypothetical protein
MQGRAHGPTMLRASGLAAVMGLAAAAGIATPVAAAPVALLDADSPGIFQAQRVPADICFVTVVARGGAGGPAFSVADGPGEPGGLGASITARVPVEPGAVLDALVAA